jgi:hypothetical protein
VVDVNQWSKQKIGVLNLNPFRFKTPLVASLVGDPFAAGGLWHPDGAGFAGPRDVATTMIYIHVLNLGGGGVHSPVDRPGSWLAWMTPPPDEDRSSNVCPRFGFRCNSPIAASEFHFSQATRPQTQ